MWPSPAMAQKMCPHFKMWGALCWLSVLLSLWSRSMARGYMSTFAGMWGCTCALEAQSLVPICYARTAFYNNTEAPRNTQFWTISGGGYFACGLSYKYRTLVCWGHRSGSTFATSLQNISYSNLNCGGWHACAVRADGTGIVDCWGDNTYGQSSPPNGSFSSVSAGDYFTCGLSKSSSLTVCWGKSITEGDQIIPDPGSQYSAIFAGKEHMCAIEKYTRRTLCWGNNVANQSQSPSQYNFSAIAGGDRHTCGIREDNHEAVCWGENIYGQLSVGAGIKFSVISAGEAYTCGVRLDKLMSVYCWGNYNKQYTGNISEAPCESVCAENQYEMDSTTLGISPCPNPGDKICVDCSRCSGSLEASSCGVSKDRICQVVSPTPTTLSKNKRTSSIIPVAVVIPVSIVAISSLVYLYWRLCTARKVKNAFGPWEGTSQGVEEFSNSELSTATRSYNEEMLLGKGASGMVYKGVLNDGRVVAVKKSTNQGSSKFFDQELRLLARLNHAYLVNLIGFCKQEKMLVFEFMENGSLFDCLFMNAGIQLDWKTRVKIAAQAAKGLEYLHVYASPRIIHRDVKTGNILVDKEMNAHVADFGLSMFGPANNDTHVSNMTVVGTPGYLDPEYFSTLQLTLKSDVYSFGIVILELLTGKKTFSQDENGAQFIGAWVSNLVQDDKLLYALDPSLTLPPDASPIIEALHLGLHCIRPSGRDRPTMTYVATALETCFGKLIGTHSRASSR